jgi:3-oxoacyl-[acyl-carrier-protein] synthase-3
MNRILLLVGDTISRISSPQDRSVAALFGDAGTATALQYEQGATPITSSTMWFTLMTDGTGSQHLTVPAGGFRQPRTSSTSIRIEREGHNLRSDEDLFMNGAEVFSFTLREVAPLVQSTLEAAGLAQEDVSYFVFHQANRFMLEHLSRKMKIANDRMLYSLADFGNTSCASIPLTISHAFGNVGRLSADNVLLAGFGVGLSWGAAVCSFRDTIVPRIIYLAGKESSVC